MSHEQMNHEREAFWAALAGARPDLGLEPSPGWEKELPLAVEGRVRMVMSVSQDRSSVYLVGRSEAAKDWIRAHQDALTKGLRTVPGAAQGEADEGRWFRKDNKAAAVTQRRQWPEMIRWFGAQHMTFTRAVSAIEPT